MNREPVNPDDPEMTAYALGELSPAESAKFEALLLESPAASRDLASMCEVMDLLRHGLSEEWLSECERPQLRLVAVANAETSEPSNVVRPFFGVRQKFAVAAVIGAMAVVGSLAVKQQTTMKSASLADRAMSATSAQTLAEATVAAADTIHTPQLLLADEIEDLSVLDLADGSEDLAYDIDSSYIGDEAITPAGFRPGPSLSRVASPERVDSYLPSSMTWASGQGFRSTLVDRDLSAREGGVSSVTENSVLVHGFVTMDGGERAATSRVSGRFQPVSISENPVVNDESDLRVLAEIKEMQADLSRMIGEMPAGSRNRSDLEQILDRSHRVSSELKSGMMGRK